MESFVVSARKYRPSDFSSVVGQKSVTVTLQNAIKNNQLAQAFLFCGPRGVGKTTCSRILAKTINCTNITDDLEACNQCDSCNSFNNGKSLNVYELDAASNNSVDDIRSLIEQVHYPPQSGKYKVYIIDEVHMLSTAAFNAFLKTLEEPPSYAIFILATTEKHKILPTILSRCQIFDFKRIQISDITQHLKFIAEKEEIAYDIDALRIIAEKADGALRDALSLFDQLSTFTAKNLLYDNVIKSLNVLDYQYYFQFVDSFDHQNIPEALLLYNEILMKGFDGHHFLGGLLEHYRNLMISRQENTMVLLEVGDNFKDKYMEQARKLEPTVLLESLNLISEAELSYKNAKSTRLHVELLIMKLCSLKSSIEKKKSSSKINLLPASTGKESGGNTNGSKQVSSPVKEEVIVPNKPAQAVVLETTEVKVAIAEPELERKQESSSVVDVVKEKRISSKSKTLSITGFLNQKKEKTNAEEFQVTSSRDNAFTKDQLLEAWFEYREKITDFGKKSLSSILKQEPELLDPSTIKIILNNSALEDEFNIEKSDVTTFLRDKLHNDSITITYEVKQIETETKLYTSKDRFSKLLEDHPQLRVLKDKFGLELDR